jgi:hypothetical protein
MGGHGDLANLNITYYVINGVYLVAVLFTVVENATINHASLELDMLIRPC